MNKMSRISPVSILIYLVLVQTAGAGQCPPTYAHTVSGSGFTRGYAVAGAGDIDKDGFADFLVGTPRYFHFGNGTAGSAQLLSGKTGAIIRGFGGGTIEDRFGTSLSPAGDFNNDGYMDIVVGAPRSGSSDNGYAAVYSGLDWSVLYGFNHPGGYSKCGQSVSWAGDVNNDGFGDVIIGAPGFEIGTQVNVAGEAFVFSGADHQILFYLTGAELEDRFGWSVSGIGDLNNDGHDDFMVSALNRDSAGAVYVFSGLDADTLFYFTAADSGDHFGIDVSSAGDVNNDSVPDIIIGASRNDENGDNAGKAYVFSGLDGDTLHKFWGESAGDEFGFAAAPAGDINKDGYDEVLIGAYLNDAGGTDAGRAYIFSGRFGDTLLIFTGDSAGDHFGFSVDGAGDIDSNGSADLVIGAPGTSYLGMADNAGTAYVYALSAGECCCLGRRGDLNGDGNNGTILDLNYLVSDIFRGGPSANCSAEADLNNDSNPSSILDLNFLVNDIFRGGPSAGACY